ncbi:MAG: metallophosphoesterase [Oculatellaceae cyanobacterium Prado106]|nr:metallophosphoesterase [Oculatellaceae cyanobacterium Prado106]
MVKFVADPAIADKIQKMKQRVRWQEPLLQNQQIDQTRFVLADGQNEDQAFSFLVIGDSGAGSHRGYHPQRKVAELLLANQQDCRFILHTGDVIYLLGSSEYYGKNFIEPYREFLVGGEHPHRIAYDRMTFKLPIFPVLGNHDYYDLPFLSTIASVASRPFRLFLRSKLDFDVGWHGSRQGDAFARAFLDYLKPLTLPELMHHLQDHYTAKTDTGRCLTYKPGQFTRLPNRYYRFQYGGIDFFALDSSTFNAPQPLPHSAQGDVLRESLEQKREAIAQEKNLLFDQAALLDPNDPEEEELLDYYHTKLTQLDEVEVDIDKQLTLEPGTVTDWEQLDWFKTQLIASWQNPNIRGRIVFFHHPPYVTETSKWQQAQTLAVRQRLQEALDAVAGEIGDLTQGRSLINLVFNGHAHCLEHLETLNTGHADSQIHWLICGGSGYSLRRQRAEGSTLIASELESNGGSAIAQSHLFIGRSGRGSHRRRPYSALRVEVQPGNPPQFKIYPLVAEWYQHEWRDYPTQPFEIH